MDNCLSDKKIHLSVSQSQWLDYVRTVSAWLVLLGHAFTYYKIEINGFGNNQIYFPFIQDIGVIILFLLSGFLTLLSMNKKRNESFLSFFLNRFSRIMLVYVPALIFTAIIDKISIALWPDTYRCYYTYNIKTFFANVFMLQECPVLSNRFGCFGTISVVWTLAVEWWLYLAFGWCFFKLFKAKVIKIYDVLIFLVLLLIPLGNLMAKSIRKDSVVFVWLLGALLYYCYLKIEESNKFFLSKTTGGGVFAALCFYGLWIKNAYDPVFVIILGVFGFLILYHKKNKVSPKQQTCMKRMSCYTYSLYLVHHPILLFIDNFNTSSQLKLFIGLISSNIIGLIFYFLFEKRSKDLEHFIKSKVM